MTMQPLSHRWSESFDHDKASGDRRESQARKAPSVKLIENRGACNDRAPKRARTMVGQFWTAPLRPDLAAFFVCVSKQEDLPRRARCSGILAELSELALSGSWE